MSGPRLVVRDTYNGDACGQVAIQHGQLLPDSAQLLGFSEARMIQDPSLLETMGAALTRAAEILREEERG